MRSSSNTQKRGHRSWSSLLNISINASLIEFKDQSRLEDVLMGIFLWGIFMEAFCFLLFMRELLWHRWLVDSHLNSEIKSNQIKSFSNPNGLERVESFAGLTCRVVQVTHKEAVGGCF